MPNNGGYLAAAYIVAGVILVGYTVALWIGGRRKE
jgi:hypothetical protein